MSHPIARRAGMLALTAAMLMPNAGALSDVSNWAQEGVAAAQNAGLAPSSLSNSAASGSITRAEFCAVALNAYKAVSGKAVYVSGKKPFEDCSDPNVTAAYLLGIVKGRTNGNFDPDAKISREEMCTMLDNILAAADIEATEIAGDACIEDYPDVSMISDYAMQPVVTMVDHSVINGITDTIHKGEVVSLIGPQTEAEKMTYVYGAGNGKYQSAAEAEAHMVEIVVPVWHLQSDGTKVASKAYLQVNASLASIYQAIFEEIFNGSEKFPIYDVGCYSWRTGEHSQGTAVDINPDENMEATINSDGSLSPTCGTHWTPYIDPYSIPEGGDVYNAFTKYGFTWGGNGWHSKRDYMHFSYFGR